MLVGYARVSSTGQNLQLEALEKAGCEKIFQEKKSGTKTYSRPELQKALDSVRNVDALIVMYPCVWLDAIHYKKCL